MGYFKSKSIEAPIQMLNLQPYSPLFDKVVVKVMYAGLNRNGSYFDREAVEQLAQSLPNTPLVGSFDRARKDFKGHEQQLDFDENMRLRMVSSTVPYGVVPSDSKIWWQWFEDSDGIKREYLCCEALLWTKRFPEIKERINAGTSNQSMEIDEDTIAGVWAKDTNTGKKIFYVKESYILGLCILGQDVQPCFQGANLSAPVSYAKHDDNFNSMLEELKEALNYEISKKMEDKIVMDNIIVNDETNLEPEVVETNPEQENIITNAEFNLESAMGSPSSELEQIILNKKLEAAAQQAQLAVLEEYAAGQGQGGGVPGEMVKRPEDEEEIDEVTEEEDMITESPEQEDESDNVPKPGLDPQQRIDEAKERSEQPTQPVPGEEEEAKEEKETVVEEKPAAPAQPQAPAEPQAPQEDEEEKKKKPPFLQNEVVVNEETELYKKCKNDLSEAYSYIQKLEMELAPLREMKMQSELREKMSLMHEFKETYGEEVETAFADKLQDMTVESLKFALGMFAFEHRDAVKVQENTVQNIVSYTVAETDNRTDFVRALDKALGRK